MLRSVFRSKWKERLHPSVKKQLEELIEKIKIHESAYNISDNPQTAKLWSALAELYTEIKFLDLRLKRIEETFARKRKRPLEEELKQI